MNKERLSSFQSVYYVVRRRRIAEQLDVDPKYLVLEKNIQNARVR